MTVQKLFGFFDGLGVIVANQGLDADKVAVAADGINSVFFHGRHKQIITDLRAGALKP